MSKVAQYLQEHLQGEILYNPAVRKHFSTDCSVFSVLPTLVVYPRNESDVRKATRFTWQLAERGRVIPITARGLGSDQSGAAIGTGIIMNFPSHMNRILEFDGKTGDIIVEPGLNYAKMQQALYTHGRCVPVAPTSVEYSTIGGAVANNAIGDKSFKYGATREYVKGLRVVLANGEVIETKRISKRELSKKMGLSTYEGEIYRAIDTLIEENKTTINDARLHVSRNSAGYALADVKQKDGSFDLTPLLVGSQGTLGIVSEIELKTIPYNPETTLIGAFFDDLAIAEQVLAEIRALSDKPCSMLVVNDGLISFVLQNNPNQLKGIVEKPYPKLVALIEFDDGNSRIQKKAAKRAVKILQKNQVLHRLEVEEREKEKLWKIRDRVATVITHAEGNAKALPIVEDAVVPVEKLQEFIAKTEELFARYTPSIPVWGAAGDAHFQVRPVLDPSQIGARQKAFRMMDEYYDLVIALGGTPSGSGGAGRLRGPYLPRLYGEAMYGVLQQVKKIFDPHGTLNPGVKIDVSLDDIRPLLRNEYTIEKLSHYLPRT